ncbi:nitroreductase family protein [Haloechinothrix sp. YIM 98757]|uniref:Nitroreductase family protein n=1 Tax=Haloechinothrix aidingensis TaxID=2752311 RepID=A0A838ACA5_9PSEU|nr:nitroreductase family protein [Haloechinothrix aidingensis]MBA0126892.1 nitroreductase family protein [Haloechinothrix aidingensis]
MDRGLPDGDTLTTALALAGRAPSVHNTQPWQWRIGNRSVHVYADPGMWLRRTDPDCRDLILSCGIALHHLRVAFAALGWRPVVHRLPNPAEPDHLASIELRRHEPADEEIAMAAAIPRRRSDRRHYSSWPVPATHSSLLAARAADEDVAVRVVRETYMRRHVVDAIARAAQSHARDAAYQLELAHWSGRHGSPAGVPARNAPAPDPEPVPGALPVRAFANPRLPRSPDHPATEDAGILLVLGSVTDDRMAVLRAGEATSAVLLSATALGLATCPLTEALEVDHTRKLVRQEVLGNEGQPHMVLRVGWAPINADPVPPTPRYPVEELSRDLTGNDRGRVGT